MDNKRKSVYRVRAEAAHLGRASFIATRPDDVFAQVVNFLDGLSLIEAGDEPVTITVSGCPRFVDQGKLIITREEMPEEEYDALPEFDGF